MRILILMLFTLFIGCTATQNCNRKIKYIKGHCPEMFKQDSVTVKIDTVLKEITLKGDTVFLPDNSALVDTLEKLGTLVKGKVITKKEYTAKVQKYSCGEFNIVKDTLGLSLHITYKNGALSYELHKDSVFISKEVKKPVASLILDSSACDKTWLYVAICSLLTNLFLLIIVAKMASKK